MTAAGVKGVGVQNYGDKAHEEYTKGANAGLHKTSKEDFAAICTDTTPSLEELRALLQKVPQLTKRAEEINEVIKKVFQEFLPLHSKDTAELRMRARDRQQDIADAARELTNTARLLEDAQAQRNHSLAAAYQDALIRHQKSLNTLHETKHDLDCQLFAAEQSQREAMDKCSKLNEERNAIIKEKERIQALVWSRPLSVICKVGCNVLYASNEEIELRTKLDPLHSNWLNPRKYVHILNPKLLEEQPPTQK